jgi:hypothetical protein
LIIGDYHPTILFLPTRNNGMMEYWNGESNRGNFITFIRNYQYQYRFKKFPISQYSSLPKSIIPIFQHSIIPIAERSGAKFFYALNPTHL